MKKIFIAVTIIVVGALMYFYFFAHDDQSDRLPDDKSQLPYGTSPTLLLSDGNTVMPGASPKGLLATDGGVQITTTDSGDIQYAVHAAAADTALLMNTLTTPKGTMCSLTLSDGTKVCVNAGSTITYPVVFGKKERKVLIRGEVYFEVNQEPGRPFVVRTYRDIVRPGTASFNVNCYADERFIKTTLVTGVVNANGFNLQPGEASENGLLVKTNAIRDVAWKDGYFDFDGVMVEEALRQIARWYDVTIQPDGGIPAVMLDGKIKRNISLGEVIKAFDGQQVRFRLEGKKLFVSPMYR